jgi:hypothetical protein
MSLSTMIHWGWQKYRLGNVLLSLPLASFFATEHEPLKEIGAWLESFVRLVAS